MKNVETRDAGADETKPTMLASAPSPPSTLYIDTDADRQMLEGSLFALALIRRRDGTGSSIGNFATKLIGQAPESYAQLFQDLFVLHMLEDKRDGFFVEVGTGDGIQISNTYLLEKTYGWNGVVVEPNPTFHDALRRNRRCAISTDCILDVSGRVVTFNCARVPEFSGVAEFSEIPGGSNENADRVASVGSVELTTVSLNDLLAKAGAPRQIDYLSLDVEGSEFAILNTFDFELWNISCLTVEHNYNLRREDVYELLLSKGYTRVFSELSRWDDWYVSTGLLNRRPDGNDFTDVLVDGGVTFGSGFGPPEGPLAELGLPRVFRWLVGLRGQLQLRSAKRGVRIIELQVRNGLPDQLMAVYLADRLIGAFELPSAGIGQLLTLRCTAFFEAGKQPITIQTACASTPDAIGRELSIIIEELVFVDGLESGTEVK
ncbi:MAG: methyltransferase [Xanthobacteraceae bacterium]|jgi:FkbM family methyltransferase|nr:methyltransferase [Xanthobacteraceae bacterium]